jgi:hypothetical protein
MMENNLPGIIVMVCACLVPITGLIIVGAVYFSSRRKSAGEKASAEVAGGDAHEEEIIVGERKESGEERWGLSCQACGAENPADNNFCEHCGMKL